MKECEENGQWSKVWEKLTMREAKLSFNTEWKWGVK